jgi:hypothetical protein
MVDTPPEYPSLPAPKPHPYPMRSPRFWHGLRFTEWLRLAASHQFRIHPSRWPMAAGITGVSAICSGLSLLQWMFYNKQIAETPITEPPVFIIGHWRSGTTLLHEYLALDEQFGCPTTYQCFAPRHFLVSEWLVANYMQFLVPNKRPMDNMEAGWGKPQEEEFALLTMAAPTPYLRMAFPNDPPPYMEFLDLVDVAPIELERFKNALLYFVKAQTLHYNKRIMMKSPPHTGRIGMLAQLFPGAKFIHIARNPLEIYSSSVRLWQSLDYVQGLQVPRHKGLEEYVFHCFERMYRGFDQQVESVPAGNLVQVRYEDIVASPIEELSKIYDRLDLGDYSKVQPKLEAVLEKNQGYQTNKHNSLAPIFVSEIRRRWSGYIERYGYESAFIADSKAGAA